jgi:hypothetical protein
MLFLFRIANTSLRIEMKVVIIPPPDSHSKDKPQKGLLIWLLIICISISAWQTFLGYSGQMTGNLALAAAIALFCGITLIGINLEIRKRIRDMKPYRLLVLLLIIPFFLSFWGILTAFYSQMTGSTSVEAAISEYHTTLIRTHTAGIEAIDSITGIAEIEAEINDKLQDLKREDNGGLGLQGWGIASAQKWKNLRKYLQNKGPAGSVITDFNPGTPANQKYALAEKLTMEYFTDVIKPTRTGPYSALVAESNGEVKALNEKIQDLQTKGISGSNGNVLLDEIMTSNNRIGNKLKVKLHGFVFTELSSSSEKDWGTISYTLDTIFAKGKSIPEAILAILLSVILNWIPLLYMKVFLKPVARTNSGKLNVI